MKDRLTTISNRGGGDGGDKGDPNKSENRGDGGGAKRNGYYANFYKMNSFHA